MSENQQNKIQVVDIFQGKPVSQNSEKSSILNKFALEKGVILNAISPNYVKKNVKTSLVNDNEKDKDKDKKNSIIFREQCEYCLTSFSVSGHLILTKESLLFEPDLRDQNVIINGYGAYQIFIDVCDIYECAHIVVPTKGTYLSFNDDTCGFVQVLLKNKYQKEADETNVKKTTQENDTNKNKGVSYYKYISKSLSFVYNFAHPLVQSSASRDDTTKEAEPLKNEGDTVKSLKQAYTGVSGLSKSLEFHRAATSEPIEFEKKSDVDTLSSYNIDVNSNTHGTSTDGNYNVSNNMLQSSSSKNVDCSSNDILERNRKNSLLNFDGDAKKNIIRHLRDNELKIYQKINQTHYSDVAGSLPVITYKNNLNTLNSKSISKESSFSDMDLNTVERDEKNEEKQKKQEQVQVQVQVQVQDKNTEQTQKKGENREKSEQCKENNVNDCPKSEETCHKDSKERCGCYPNSRNKDVIDFEKKENEIEIELTAEYKKGVNTGEKEATSSIIKKSVSHKIHNNDTLNTPEIFNVNKHMDNSSALLNKERHLHPETDMYHTTNLNKHKKYEERSFVLFRFFNNARAYETTVKIIKEIDEVRKSGKQMKKTITSVPFTSNELLKYIIEQSLRKGENANTKMQNLKICDNNNDSANSTRKSNFNSLSFNFGKEQKYQVIEPKLEYVDGAVKLINKHMSKQINYYLPPTISIKIWKLAFCTSIHGVSFKTLYRSVKNKGYVLLIIYDMNNILFGYFADQLNCDNCYYGSGENFLFTFMTEGDVKQKEKRKEEKMRKNDEMKESHLPAAIKLKHYSVASSNSNKYSSEGAENVNITNEKNERDSNRSFDSSGLMTSNDYRSVKNVIDKDPRNTHSNLFSKTMINAAGDLHKEKEITIAEKIRKESEITYKQLEKEQEKEKKHVDESSETCKSIKVYPWTSKNNYFMYSDEKSIMIGGGDNYALVINEDLCKGQTNKSSTYDNDLLTLDEEFEIQFLQLWVFQDY